MPLRTKYSDNLTNSQEVMRGTWAKPDQNTLSWKKIRCYEHLCKNQHELCPWVCILSLFLGNNLLCPRWLKVGLEKAPLPMDRAIILEHFIKKKKNGIGSTGIYGNQESKTGDYRKEARKWIKRKYWEELGSGHQRLLVGEELSKRPGKRERVLQETKERFWQRKLSPTFVKHI